MDFSKANVSPMNPDLRSVIQQSASVPPSKIEGKAKRPKTIYYKPTISINTSAPPSPKPKKKKTRKDYEAEELKQQYACICAGCCFLVMALCLIGGGVTLAEYNKNIANGVVSQCKYYISETTDCSGTVRTGKMTSECTGKHNIYYYSANTTECLVYYSTSCECNDQWYSGITDPEPPKKNDGKWHKCKVIDCDENGFVFLDNLNEEQVRYTATFITAGICGFLCTVLLCYAIYLE